MEKNWWHSRIAYQIYPKSFCDSNGDGIGDLQGIISRLDYLKWLGIDIIWLSPVYQSPFVDQGYDISDYCRIADEFGTMDDFDRLLAETRKRGMHVVMDLVVNHCSDRHEWFQKALANPYGEYAGYFYFRKGRDGKPPSNYRSYFGGSAWEPVPGTDMYYLHFFAKEQPDLNWENPDLRRRIYEMVNWWLEKGVAGFRIDAIMNIKKDLSFPDYAPDGPDGLVQVNTMIHHVKGIGDFLGELRDTCFVPHNAFTVGEVFDLDADGIREFIGENGYFSTMFDFSQHLLFSSGKHGWYDALPFDFERWKGTIIRSQQAAQEQGCRFAVVTENHDQPRGCCVYLPEWAMENEADWINGTKALAAVVVLLRGIPFIYQGQELGMRCCRMDSIDDYDDISTKDQYLVARGAGLSNAEALDVCFKHSRDNARTPFQWNGRFGAGFTSGTPWLKINPDYVRINMEDERKDENSVLNWYRSLIALRKSSEFGAILAEGSFAPAFADMPDVFAFIRSLEGRHIMTILNFGRNTAELRLGIPFKVLLSDRGEVSCNEGVIRAGPLQTVVLYFTQKSSCSY